MDETDGAIHKGFRDLAHKSQMLGLLKKETIKIKFRSKQASAIKTQPLYFLRRETCHCTQTMKKNVTLHVLMVIFVIVPTTLFLSAYFSTWEKSELKCFLEGSVLNYKGLITDSFRPKMACAMCRSLKEVPVVTNITREEFDRFYAYTGMPLKVIGAVSNWNAVNIFSLHFFKSFYKRNTSALRAMSNECQFFVGHNTKRKPGFESIEDVFNMSDERIKQLGIEQQWYIGWSNCLAEFDQLSEYFERPSLLRPSPNQLPTPEWIFIGTHGNGAPLHVDDVSLPSWQAQIRGSKIWTLIPTPECITECSNLQVTLESGDLFFVDTNVWYHSTYINPGTISISIGSEYD